MSLAYRWRRWDHPEARWRRRIQERRPRWGSQGASRRREGEWGLWEAATPHHGACCRRELVGHRAAGRREWE